jgi:hypothetical protein
MQREGRQGGSQRTSEGEYRVVTNIGILNGRLARVERLGDVMALVEPIGGKWKSGKAEYGNNGPLKGFFSKRSKLA